VRGGGEKEAKGTRSEEKNFTITLFLVLSHTMRHRGSHQDSNPCPETDTLDQLGYLDFVVTFF